MTETKIARMQRRIDKRDKVIAAQRKYIQALESELASAVTMPDKVHDAVQRALCNVRMIPVLGLGKEDKIISAEAAKPANKGAAS